MNTKTAAALFEVLTSETRLSIFRLLVKYAPAGLVAGEIARMLDIPKTNLSFHLKTLVHGGLAGMEREGRHMRYRASIPLMHEAIDFLTAECCTGGPGQGGTLPAENRTLPMAPGCCGSGSHGGGGTAMDASGTPGGGELVREAVRATYAAIAGGQRRSCCGPGSSCCGDPGGLSQALGYGAGDLAGLPEGADMGLSCGNPIAMASLKEGQSVLDLGSGGGFDVFQAGQRVKAQGRVIGVDMTPEMIALARRNAAAYRERTGYANVEFRLGEIEHLPVPDASVDVVLSNCVINLSPDKPQVWREAFRVLRPGGKAFVSDMALFMPLPAGVREMASAWVGCVAGAALVEETRGFLAEAGFSKVVLTPSPGYVRRMQDLNDPLYRQIAAALPEGRELADYITSLSIEAVKC